MAFLSLQMRIFSSTFALCLILFLFAAAADGQELPPSQTKTLLRLPRLLQYPPALAGWSADTPFCSLSSPSLSIACSGGRIVELSISGDRPAAPGADNALSPAFTSDSVFTTLSRLPSLTTISLVALGLWGPLPRKVDRFPSLKVLNLSSNYFAGAIPLEISTMTSLQNLILSGNSFNGSVPDLKSLTSLVELDVGVNRLGPEFPSLSNTLITLVLKNNSFAGKIPASLAAFHELKTLDLSANHLSEWIPPMLFSLPSLEHLDVSDNKLTGEIPRNVSCSIALEFIDITNNLLVGGLPSCLGSNSWNKVVMSSGNCLNARGLRNQHSNAYCEHGAFAALLPPANMISGSNSNVGVILGVAGGVVVVAALLVLLVFLVSRRARAEEEEATMMDKPLAQDTTRNPGDAGHKYVAVRMKGLGLTPYRILTIEELQHATESFDPSKLFEDSARGQFYKGQLQDGSLVTVRRLKLNQKLLSQNLPQYLDLISKLRHPHLASVIGHCIISSQDAVDTTAMVYLVSEYISNGTLRSHLTEWRKQEMLKWPQRLAAVTGVAKGIQFLHNVMVPGIFGNDINIENVLLDKTLTAKMSNYNLPILPKIKNKVFHLRFQHLMLFSWFKFDLVSVLDLHAGYEGPFIALDGRDLSSFRSLEHGEKEDIYQFGFILLEIITGKPIRSSSNIDSLRSELQKRLIDSPAELRVADPTIQGTFAADSLRTAAEIALKCVLPVPNKRPSIDDVLWNLQYAAQIQDGWAAAGENLIIQV